MDKANVQPGLVRLNKAIAARGYCSRRKADELIFAARVKVDGIVVANPAFHVAADARIEIDGRVLDDVKEFTYAIINKPVQCVCTMKDPQGRSAIVDYFPPEYLQRRLYPVGRLDYFSEGLLILTNDGQFAMRMAHPRHHQIKKYEVIVRGSVASEKLEKMRKGMFLAEGKKLLPVDVSSTPLPCGDTKMIMGLRQGINRQIRKMCDQLDLTILKLCRVSQGCLELGDLKPGQTRLLNKGEINQLLKSVGLA